MMATGSKSMFGIAGYGSTINGYDWSNRYTPIVEEAMRINVTAIMDAEVICTDGKGVPAFEKLQPM